MHAYILRRDERRDVDEVVTVHTMEFGKLVLSARGSKKIISKNSPRLMVGEVVDLSVIQGKETWYVGSVHATEADPTALLSVEARLAWEHVLGLVDIFSSERSGDEGVFSLLEKTRAQFEDVSVTPTAAVIFFIVQYLCLVGYGYTLSACVVCARPVGLGWWDFAHGGLLCDEHEQQKTHHGVRLSFDACGCLSSENFFICSPEISFEVYRALRAYMRFVREGEVPDWEKIISFVALRV